MKMLISYLYCNKGGVTSVIKQRMPILQNNGWIVDAAFESDHGGGEELLLAGIRQVHIFGSAFKSAVQTLLNEGDYDVHVIFDTPDLINLSHPAKTKIIFEVHTPIITTIKGYEKAALERSQAIFVPSAWSKATILDLIPYLSSDHIRVIPNIVENKIFTTEGHAFHYPKTLLWVGKLAEYKNWEEAMKVGGMFLQENPDWNFVAVTGGQSNAGYVSNMLLEFIDRDRVANFKWLHNLSQHEIASLYRGVAQNGGFLLSTSKAESFCLVVHEAMRCGLPVISTNVGPIPEIIEDQESGLLYTAGNLRDCMQKCKAYLNADMRTRMAQGGFISLKKFDQPVLEQMYITNLSDVLGL
jgi:glycosyltransferase involved in cell wall biosynthesis